ncbi:hypothetical protein I7I48_07032 [Histoplasma ohiense]|nr:hypothetical protein I7I48_07032 [Histoplasma ohiense (nom. inval.)]
MATLCAVLSSPCSYWTISWAIEAVVPIKRPTRALRALVAFVFFDPSFHCSYPQDGGDVNITPKATVVTFACRLQGKCTYRPSNLHYTENIPSSHLSTEGFIYIPSKDIYMTRRQPFDILPSLAGSAKEMAVRGRQPPIPLQVTTRQGVLFTFPQILLVHVQYIYRAGDVLRLEEDNFICFIRLWPVLSTDSPILLLLMVGGGRSRVAIDSGMTKEHQCAGEDTNADSIVSLFPLASPAHHRKSALILFSRTFVVRKWRSMI